MLHKQYSETVIHFSTGTLNGYIDDKHIFKQTTVQFIYT